MPKTKTCLEFHLDLFFSSNGAVDNKYYQENSPAGTAFAIVWPIIYLWNAAAILYIFISMFLFEDKSPVNIKPTLIPIVSHDSAIYCRVSS